MDFNNQVKPSDLVQVLPLHAMTWDQVDRVQLPPQPAVVAFKPVDLRVSRWELYEETRHVPVTSSGKVLHTLVLPWNLSMDRARHRVDECAPPRQHWLLTAVSAENWIVHQLVYPDMVRLRLEELDQFRQAERGGMRVHRNSHCMCS